jgi:hypothetical protein
MAPIALKHLHIIADNSAAEVDWIITKEFP